MIDDEQKWLEKRLNYVTSTEVSVLLGWNKYKSLASLLRTKRRVVPIEKIDSMYFVRGHEWEDTVLKRACNVLKYKFTDINQQDFRTHPEVAISATVDAWLPKHKTLIEAKCTGHQNVKKWLREGPPLNYISQIMVQALTTPEAEKLYLAGMFFKQWPHDPKVVGFIMWEIEKNEELCNLILDFVKKFWYICNNEPEKTSYRLTKEEREMVEKIKGNLVMKTIIEDVKETEKVKFSETLTSKDLRIVKLAIIQTISELGVYRTEGEHKHYLNNMTMDGAAYYTYIAFLDFVDADIWEVKRTYNRDFTIAAIASIKIALRQVRQIDKEELRKWFNLIISSTYKEF